MFNSNKVILLHGIKKKKQKTPPNELLVAFNRMHELHKEKWKMNWKNAKDIIEQDKNVQEELKNNENEYKIIEEIIFARHERNLSQKELAELVGTKQSNISRLESGNYNPTIDFLSKIVNAMDKKLEVRII
jgi:ribosome-binding protein aMBF1 (putative translation factor)